LFINYQHDFSTDQPNFVTCQPGRISWTGGQAPFVSAPSLEIISLITRLTLTTPTPFIRFDMQFLSILPGSNTAAVPLVDLGEQTSNVYVWNANVRE
jgi:hypothetical protein